MNKSSGLPFPKEAVEFVMDHVIPKHHHLGGDETKGGASIQPKVPRQKQAEAEQDYDQEVIQGQEISQNLLCVIYCDGQSVAQDFDKAVEWYEKAAAQGDAYAQFYLGKAYRSGNGVVQDYNKAKEWFVKAAAQGDAAAQSSLGAAYYNGHGVLNSTRLRESSRVE